jgi:hypothetical protein
MTDRPALETAQNLMKRLRDMPVSIPLAETTGAYIDIGDEAADMIDRLLSAAKDAERLREAATNLSNFAWSGLTADQPEGAEYLNQLVAALRAALSALYGGKDE